MKTVFILHGWTYSTDKWRPFIRLMEAKGVKSVLLNVPGLIEGTAKVWTLNDYVEWLKQRLETEKRPILIGHSNGGRIAIAFASKYPEKLGRLVLIDSAGIYHNELPLRLKRWVFRSLAKIGKMMTSSEKMRRLLYKFAGESDYKNATPPMRQTMVNLISLDLISLLDKITTPALIIWGKQDKITPLSDGKLINKHLINSLLFVINEAEHSPFFTHPEAVSERILSEILK